MKTSSLSSRSKDPGQISPLVHCALEASPHRGETDRLEARVDDYGGHVGGVDAQLGLLRLLRSLHG